MIHHFGQDVVDIICCIGTSWEVGIDSSQRGTRIKCQCECTFMGLEIRCLNLNDNGSAFVATILELRKQMSGTSNPILHIDVEMECVSTK